MFLQQLASGLCSWNHHIHAAPWREASSSYWWAGSPLWGQGALQSLLRTILKCVESTCYGRVCYASWICEGCSSWGYVSPLSLQTWLQSHPQHQRWCLLLQLLLLSGLLGFITAEVCELLSEVCVGSILNSFLPSIILVGGPKHFRVYVKAPDARLILVPSIEINGICLGKDR